jgi:hypothetical protein
MAPSYEFLLRASFKFSAPLFTNLDHLSDLGEVGVFAHF